MTPSIPTPTAIPSAHLRLPLENEIRLTGTLADVPNTFFSINVCASATIEGGVYYHYAVHSWLDKHGVRQNKQVSAGSPGGSPH